MIKFMAEISGIKLHSSPLPFIKGKDSKTLTLTIKALWSPSWWGLGGGGRGLFQLIFFLGNPILY